MFAHRKSAPGPTRPISIEIRNGGLGKRRRVLAHFGRKADHGGRFVERLGEVDDLDAAPADQSDEDGQALGGGWPWTRE
jgi:hypothetical protein